MPVGDTIVASLQDSVETIIAASRMRREFGTVMTRVVDNETLDKNTGTAWNETTVETMNAQDIDELTDLNNFQQYVDVLLSVTPTIIGLAVFITDRAKARVSTKTLAQMGKQPQNAIERRKDKDGLVILDSFTAVGSAGTTITAGHLRAAHALNRAGGVTGTTAEPWDGAQVTIIHSYQHKVLEDEIEGGLGTYPVPNGLSEEVYKNGYQGRIAQSELFIDDNLVIDTNSDVKGGTFARGDGGAIVLVNGIQKPPKFVRNEFKGGGGESVVTYDEYKYAIRQTNWGTEDFFDAPTPTS